MDLPVLLAGPILRRVEATSVTVWAAFSKKQFVQLAIWNNGTEKCDDNEIKKIEGVKATSVPAETFEISSKFHIALITIDTSADKLQELKAYSYNLYFGDTNIVSPATTLAKDLGTEGYLKKAGIAPKDFFPLGYNPSALPTIVLPNEKVENLHIVHGSCRKIHGVGDDAFQQVDVMLNANISPMEDPTNKASTRLQQLYLTGDQIYADETPMIVLPFINALGKQLFNDKVEKVIVKATSAGTTAIDCEIKNFPSAQREFLINETAKLTGNGISSHLLTFQEYCATYLHYWCPDVWDPRLKTMLEGFRKQKYNRDIGEFHYYFLVNSIKDVDVESRFELIFNPDRIKEIFKDLADPKAAIIKMQTALKGTPPPITTQQQAKVDKWKTAYQPDGQLFEGFDDIVKIMQITEASGFDQTALSLFFTKDSVLNESKACCDFFIVLPLARRVLANVPTYMIFDDHDVTDDWNFSKFWVNRVNTSSLGVQVLRNALMAYTIFQDWGNVPAEYPVSLLNAASTDQDFQTKMDSYSNASGKAKGNKIDLLQKISKYGKAIAAGQPPEAPGELSNSLDTLLILGQDVTTETKFVTPIRWHYDIPAGKAHTYFLDTRTRRDYEELIACGGLLSQKALDEQLPERIAQENYPVVFVVSAAPAIGLPVIEEFAQPLAGMADGGTNKAGVGGAPPGAISGALKRDNEAWGFSEKHLEMFLQRLALFKKAVILSGDVHFGYSCYVDYWKEITQSGDGSWVGTHSRIIQLVSSSMKNGWDLEFTLLKSGFAQRLLNAYDHEFEKHGWKDKKVKVSGDISPRHRIRLRRNPTVLPKFGWELGTTTDPQKPDWIWRMRILADQRYYSDVEPIDDPMYPDDVLSIPNFSFGLDNDLPTTFPATSSASQKNAVKTTYLQMTNRSHSLFMLGRTRRLIWQPHVGHVHFIIDVSPDTFVLQNEVLYNCRIDGLLNEDTAPDLDSNGVRSVTTVHTVKLDAVSIDKNLPTLLGIQPPH